MTKRLWVAGLLAASVVGATGYVAGRARAAGVPTAGALTYSGTLTDTSGSPVAGPQNIQISVYDKAVDGALQCIVGPAMQPLVAGNFQVDLTTCAAAIHAHPDLWAEVFVGGGSLGRTKLGAVPYALQAETASEAAGALAARLTAIDGKEPFAGTYPAVSGWGNGTSHFCGAAPASLDLSVDTPTAAPGASNAFGGLLLTRGGATKVSLYSHAPCPSTNNVCASPVTFFLKAETEHNVSVSAYLDNAGAVYLNGVPVATNLSGRSVVQVKVPAGSFALSFLGCSTDGPSVGFEIYEAFIADPANALTVDYDRALHRNGK